VFTNTAGAPLNKDNFVAQSFKRILRDAGLPAIRFHDLRHTSASLLLASGQSHKVVQERLGHANASITLNTYAHVGQTMQRDAADLFDQILGGGPSGPF
jgi:integrase